jgi:hypothetical protein
MVANVSAGMLRAAKTDKESGMNFMGTLKKIFVSLVDRFLLVEDPFKFRRVWLASIVKWNLYPFQPELRKNQHKILNIFQCF